MDSNLETILSLLNKHNVKMFRHKTETDYIEVVLGDLPTEDVEEETMEEQDISLYSTNSIGISKKSFDEDVSPEESAYFKAKSRIRGG